MSEKRPLFQSTKQREYCPQCQAELHIKRGKKGLFLGCSNYPQCDYLKPLQQTSHIIKDLTEHCPHCGHFLQVKQGAFGIFIGCSHYPECDFTIQDSPAEAEQFTCPECHQHNLVARRGRTGKTFYGCAGYPQCRFTLATQPVHKVCPKCQGMLATEKKLKGKKVLVCVNKHCQHIFDEE